MNKVAIIVDNPLRDLPGLTLVAWKLGQLGVEAYLVPMYQMTSELWRIRPNFVVLNYLRENNQTFVRRLLASGFSVGIMETEGGVFSLIPDNVQSKNKTDGASVEDGKTSYEEYALTMASDWRIRERVALLCSWSQPFAEYAIKRKWYRSDQIVVTGTPRTDFYSDRWRNLALEVSSDQYVSDDRDLILINGSFPLANPGFQTPEEEIEMMIKRFGYRRSFVERWRDIQQNGMEGLVAVANELATAHPGSRFVYRPHPFEDMGYYQKNLVKQDNLQLLKEGTVDGWLLRAKALVHSGSSTAQEAGLAGIPAFTPRWLPTHLPIPVQDSASIWCENIEELVRSVDEVGKGTFEIPTAIQEALRCSIESTFFHADGESFDRVAVAIHQCVGKSSPPNFKQAASYLSNGLFPWAGYFWRNKMGFLLKSIWNGKAAVERRENKHFDNKVVERFIRGINHISGGGDSGLCSHQDGRSVRVSTLASRA